MKKILAMILALALVFALGLGTATVLAAEGPEDVEATAPGSDITSAVNDVVSAALKLVVAAVVFILTKYVIPFAKSTIVPFIRNTIIPWFEEHRLRSVVDRMVHGAEQLANSGQIPKGDKKQYVVDMLTAMGIEVTPEVDAIIEGAVLDLGKTLKELLQAVLDDIKDKGTMHADPVGAPGVPGDTLAVPDLPQVEPCLEKGDAPDAGDA